MKRKSFLSFWIEVIQENEAAALEYFVNYTGFKTAMRATNKTAYIDFFRWYQSK